MEWALGGPILAMVHPSLGSMLQLYPLELRYPQNFDDGDSPARFRREKFVLSMRERGEFG